MPYRTPLAILILILFLIGTVFSVLVAYTPLALPTGGAEVGAQQSPSMAQVFAPLLLTEAAILLFLTALLSSLGAFLAKRRGEGRVPVLLFVCGSLLPLLSATASLLLALPKIV